ncbi:MAG: site-2 protease family protein [Cyanobacteria bacterium SID2]|nr:site-2 protease family protein [Cyanobacteria bacterium SID2]MBP0002931.1 site-2 protease family protein [Cyanobacteria bacterium SBC]
MQSGTRIGSLFGIPLYIHSSWLIIVALFTFAKGLYWQEQYEQWSQSLAFGIGFASSILLFVSVLLHELGHSLVAISQGIKVNSITLFLFGGIAAIDRESKTPVQAFQVAIAGPFVSFALFVGLNLLASAFSSSDVPDAPIRVLTQNLAQINLVLCLFNLIPGLPLDGGQVLKAILWQVTGDRFKAVRTAAQVGSLLGGVAIFFGLFVALTIPGFTVGFWIALIGWFIWQNASTYDRVATLQQILVNTSIADAMTRHFRVVEGNLTLRDFTDRYLLSELYEDTQAKHYPYFAASEGRYRGALKIDDLRYIERSLWETKTLNEIAHPLGDLVTVRENTSLLDGILVMERQKLRDLIVLTPADAIAGILDRGDIVQTVAQKLGMTVPKLEIDRIKAEGKYPNSFQLNAIAEATSLEQ